MIKNQTKVTLLLFSVNNRQKPAAENYYRLGMAYYAKGDLMLAKQTLRKALELDPKLPDAATVNKDTEFSKLSRLGSQVTSPERSDATLFAHRINVGKAYSFGGGECARINICDCLT
jgi:tetratricopeptide (TPR) repeat protein